MSDCGFFQRHNGFYIVTKRDLTAARYSWLLALSGSGGVGPREFLLECPRCGSQNSHAQGQAGASSEPDVLCRRAGKGSIQERRHPALGSSTRPPCRGGAARAEQHRVSFQNRLHVLIPARSGPECTVGASFHPRQRTLTGEPDQVEAGVVVDLRVGLVGEIAFNSRVVYGPMDCAQSTIRKGGHSR
jgi:hypothetical protein